jgi:hypothetical protein
MNRECVTCKHISNCATVTPEKILAHFVCDHHEEVHVEEVRARCEVITLYGTAGLKVLLDPPQEDA